MTSVKSQKLIHVLIGIVCLGVFPHLQAVTPPPDGGYPNGNTAEGQNALLNLTSGGYNAAVGYFALGLNSTGAFCTAIGAAALLNNTADQNTATGTGALLNNASGTANTATGAFALYANTIGDGNTAIGTDALFHNTANANTATGNGALFSNTTGIDNTAVGAAALHDNVTGNDNTATGILALTTNTTGFDNTATGSGALEFNDAGANNTATGVNALSNNTSGDDNTATGVVALVSNTTGANNTATGYQALFHNTIGMSNTAIGRNALVVSTTGGFNTAIGDSALASDTVGTANTAIGEGALGSNTTGAGNVALGAAAGFNATTGTNNIYIGNEVEGVAGESNACYIGSIFNQLSSGGTQVFVNTNGKLGTTPSSRRFKDDIKPMDDASDAILALKPVTFHYKQDPKAIPQFGLVAEDVEVVNPDLVIRDRDGKANSVRYEAVNAMLLNEFLKEHKTVQEQGATIAELKKEIAALTAGLSDQAAKIQEMSAHVDMSKSGSQTVAINQ